MPPSIEVLALQAKQIEQQIDTLRQHLRTCSALSSYEGELARGILHSCWLLSFTASSTLAAAAKREGQMALTAAERAQAEEASSRG